MEYSVSTYPAAVRSSGAPRARWRRRAPPVAPSAVTDAVLVSSAVPCVAPAEPDPPRPVSARAVASATHAVQRVRRDDPRVLGPGPDDRRSLLRHPSPPRGERLSTISEMRVLQQPHGRGQAPDPAAAPDRPTTGRRLPTTVRDDSAPARPVGLRECDRADDRPRRMRSGPSLARRAGGAGHAHGAPARGLTARPDRGDHRPGVGVPRPPGRSGRPDRARHRPARSRDRRPADGPARRERRRRHRRRGVPRRLLRVSGRAREPRVLPRVDRGRGAARRRDPEPRHDSGLGGGAADRSRDPGRGDIPGARCRRTRPRPRERRRGGELGRRVHRPRGPVPAAALVRERLRGSDVAHRPQRRCALHRRRHRPRRELARGGYPASVGRAAASADGRDRRHRVRHWCPRSIRA